MKLTSDSAKFTNGRFGVQPRNFYRGSVERMAGKFTPEQIEMMIAIEYVIIDMEKVQRGNRQIQDYELNIHVNTGQEYDFAFNEIKNCIRLHRDADPAFDSSNWEAENDMPGDHFRYWVCRADESYIGINVRWAVPDIETQTKINETKQMAAQAYA